MSNDQHGHRSQSGKTMIPRIRGSSAFEAAMGHIEAKINCTTDGVGYCPYAAGTIVCKGVAK